MSKLIKLSVMLVSLQILAGCASSGSNGFGQSNQKDFSNMYLRGVFNWWEVSEAFKLKLNDNGQYAVTIELIADGQPYDFKVADSNWTMILNCGTEFGSDPMDLGENAVLVCASDSINLQFTPSETGMFQFTLDASNNNAPRLLIERMD